MHQPIVLKTEDDEKMISLSTFASLKNNAAVLSERQVVVKSVTEIVDRAMHAAASSSAPNLLLTADCVDTTAREIRNVFHRSTKAGDVDVNLCMLSLATHYIESPTTTTTAGHRSLDTYTRLAFIIMLTQKLPEYNVGWPNMIGHVLQTIFELVDESLRKQLFPLVLASCSSSEIHAYLKRCNEDSKEMYDRHCNNMLKFFNDVLRREQHAASADLRGQVRIAIDRMLGFGHQSGLHLIDEFDTPAHHYKSNVVVDTSSIISDRQRNISNSGAAEASVKPSGDVLPATDAPAAAAPATTTAASEQTLLRKLENEALETKIQQIRTTFCESKGISSILSWRKFSLMWEEIMKKFRETPIDDNYFQLWPTPPPEYTSDRVLNDNCARLLLCIQFVMYAEYWLNSSTETAASTTGGAKSSTAAAAHHNKAASSITRTGYTLNEDQKAWFRDQCNTCYGYIDTYGRRIELLQQYQQSQQQPQSQQQQNSVVVAGGMSSIGSTSVPPATPVRQLMQLELAWNEWKAERGKTVWTRPATNTGLIVSSHAATAAAPKHAIIDHSHNNSLAANIQPPKVRIDSTTSGQSSGAGGRSGNNNSTSTKTVQPHNIIKLLRASKKTNTVRVGPDYLNRLWNLNPKNKEEFKEANYFEPGLEYLVGVLEEADPVAQMEDEFKAVRDANFQFRALRILRKHCSSFLNPNMVVQNVGSYLEEIVTKKIRDKVVAEAREKGVPVNAPTILAAPAPSSNSPTKQQSQQQQQQTATTANGSSSTVQATAGVVGAAAAAAVPSSIINSDAEDEEMMMGAAALNDIGAAAGDDINSADANDESAQIAESAAAADAPPVASELAAATVADIHQASDEPFNDDNSTDAIPPATAAAASPKRRVAEVLDESSTKIDEIGENATPHAKRIKAAVTEME